MHISTVTSNCTNDGVHFSEQNKHCQYMKRNNVNVPYFVEKDGLATLDLIV